MKNNNCPICGSIGDDLIFKFYCLSSECINHVPNAKKEQVGNINKEIKFLKHTDIYKDFEFIKNNIFSAMNVPKEYFPMPTPLPLWATPEVTLSPSLVPKFEISWVDSLTIECHWKDKIPDILDILIEPILERSLDRYTEEVTKEVSKMLYRLTNKGWLTWNGHEARWEVHCAG